MRGKQNKSKESIKKKGKKKKGKSICENFQVWGIHLSAMMMLCFVSRLQKALYVFTLIEHRPLIASAYNKKKKKEKKVFVVCLLS